MRVVFADTGYWVATINARDTWRAAAMQAVQRLGKARYVTTDLVLVETLNLFCDLGPDVRLSALRYVRALMSKAGVEVVPQNRDVLLAGMGLYERRPDKDYSLTDCVSFNLMRERGIRDALTTDHHFEQEGFIRLIVP